MAPSITSVLVRAVCIPLCLGLKVTHNFDAGMKPFSYQTFSGVAMFSPSDAPATSSPGNGRSYIEFDLDIERDFVDKAAFIEVIVIPDINIDDIGFKDQKSGALHLCCSYELVGEHGCTDDTLGTLIIPKHIKGLYRKQIHFEEEQSVVHFKERAPVSVTAIHVFALSSCDADLELSEGRDTSITFSGHSVWMNPYGQLPGDVYGYLPFYGWMCVAYLVMAGAWFLLNAIHYAQLLHVQNVITCVLALCLVEMATWYFHYLHLNQVGEVHHGPFIVGLLATCGRRTVSRMLVVAVSLGYGVVAPSLARSTQAKIGGLGMCYLVFAFMFEALIHYNQTEKVESWMRVVLIPPVAIINGVFWWWTFVALNRTIEQLKIRRQSAKLQLYKSFTLVLVVTLVAAITFAIYEMYYVLKELYFAQWQKLWFMEVGFWQMLFSAIFLTICVLWRPSEHFKRYAYYNQGAANDDIDDDEEAQQFNAPDTFADSGNVTKRRDRDADSDDALDGGQADTPARFAIDDEDEDDAPIEANKPKTTLADTLDIEMTQTKVD